MSTPPGPIARVTRSRQQARALYDRLSASYDWVAGIWEQKPRQAGLDALGAQPGERVLEIGPATGSALVSLLEQVGGEGSVVGVDLSARMLAVASRRLSKSGAGCAGIQAAGLQAACLQARARLICADALYLPFGPSHFDAIFSSFTLELFDTPEIPRLLAECRRVLRPTGRMVMVSLSKACQANTLTRLYEWSHTAFPGVVDCRPIYLAESLASSGFVIEQASQQSLFGLPVEIVRAIPD